MQQAISDHVAELRRLSTHPTTQQYFSQYVSDLLNSSADVIETLRSRTSRAANVGTICNIDNLEPEQRRSFIVDVLKQSSNYRNQINDLYLLIDGLLADDTNEVLKAVQQAKELLAKREL